jgi:Flp pilus assembly protein TadD
MPVRIRSKRGVDEDGAKEVAPLARAVAAKHPKDAAVLDALAEAEFDAGNDDAAIKAADAAIALNPSNINALLQKGYAMARMADSAKVPKKAWGAVRKQFLKVNEIENDHPIPLVRFYQSYVANGDEPTDNALDGLVWAMELAPFDKGLRLNVAKALIDRERFDDAIIALRPILNETHNEELGKFAQELKAMAESKKAEAVATAKPAAH